MKKIRLDNLYQSSLPPTDISILWVDVDENIGEIRAIHRYNKKESSWEPYLVSVEYLTEREPDDSPITGPPDL